MTHSIANTFSYFPQVITYISWYMTLCVLADTTSVQKNITRDYIDGDLNKCSTAANPNTWYLTSYRI